MRRLVGLVLLGLAALALTACGQDSNKLVWHQKLIIEVETPQGLKTGSSVMEGSVRPTSTMQQATSGNVVSLSLSGEAAIVEVAPGRYLFALLDGDETLYRTFNLFFPGQDKDYIAFANSLQGSRESRVLPQKSYPMLLTFGDSANPKTAKQVDPANLAAAFGSGVRLKGMTLEITDEAVTEGRVETVLEWLTWSREKFLAFGGGENPIRIQDNSPVGYETLGRTSFREKAN